MGALVKFLLFAFVAYWIFKGVFRYFFGNMIKQAQQQQQQFRQQQSQANSRKSRPAGSNVDVEMNAQKKKPRKSSENYKGGEYVDYEEVK